MKERDMQDVATFMHDVVVKKDKPGEVGRKVGDWRQKFRTIQYCYGEAQPAYKFWKLA